MTKDAAAPVRDRWPVRPPRWRMSVSFRLGLAVAIALSPILALGALQATVAFNRDAAVQRTALTQAALRSASGARARIQAAAAILESVSAEAIGLQCAPRLAGLLDRTQGYQNFVRFNAQGRIQCAAATATVGSGVAASPWFQRLMHGAALAAASSPPGLSNGRQALLAGASARDAAGRFDGAFVAILSVESLKPDVSDSTLPRGTEVALIDSAGRVVASSNSGAFAPPPPGWQQRAASQGADFFDADRILGQRRVHAVAPLVGQDLFVELSAPEEGFWSWTRLNALWSVVLPVMAWIAAWSAVWAVADRVVIRWLSYLDRIAAIYAKGRFSVRPVQAEGAPREFRDLAVTLDTMADAIVARDLSLRESLAQKDAMMREIHHRVKNNLQVINSLLNMQQRALTDPAARDAMTDTRQRITALALIYRALYQSPDLRRVDVRQFLEELVGQLSAGEGGRPSPIRTDLEADDLEIDPDKLPPLALFAVEAITNARKHAFDHSGGLIRVRFAVSPDQIVFEVADNGRGDQSEPAAAGVGRTLMSAFARQLRGDMAIEAAEGGGTVVRLNFPPPEPPRDDPTPFQLTSGRNP